MAFVEFSHRARALQELQAQPEPDPAAIDDALRDLDKARLLYNDCRDALAAEFLPKEAHQRTAATENHRDFNFAPLGR